VLEYSGKQLLLEKEALYRTTCNLMKKVIADISYQIILPEIPIVICATFDLGENSNLEYEALLDAHILSHKLISGHTIKIVVYPAQP
jgi:hypothetical protein